MDIVKDDIIRVTRDTQGVEASDHLLRVVKVNPEHKTVWARYLSRNDLTYGSVVIRDDSGERGLVLDADHVSVI